MEVDESDDEIERWREVPGESGRSNYREKEMELK